jgi:hypothetical protein
VVTDIVETIERDGIWIAPKRWEGIGRFMEYLKKQRWFTGHVYPQSDRMPKAFATAMAHDALQHPQRGFMCIRFENVLQAPGFFDFAMQFQPVADAYFGDKPANFYAVNSMYKKSTGRPGWHYDLDGEKLLVLFMYGSDIRERDDGPHCYLRGSHRWLDWRRRRLQNLAADVEPADVGLGDVEEVQVYGRAGTFFLSDPSGIHNGRAPAPGNPPRLLTWARWSDLDPPWTYKNDELYPIPASEIPMRQDYSDAIKERTKLLVDWGS